MELGDDRLVEARQMLLKSLGALDKLAYDQQISASKDFDPSNALVSVRASVSALDTILERLS